jgi:hypothetical protein
MVVAEMNADGHDDRLPELALLAALTEGLGRWLQGPRAGESARRDEMVQGVARAQRLLGRWVETGEVGDE